MPEEKFKWGNNTQTKFKKIEKIVANITKINFYNPLKDTRVKATVILVQPSNKKLGRASRCKLQLHHAI